MRVAGCHHDRRVEQAFRMEADQKGAKMKPVRSSLVKASTKVPTGIAGFD
jgi:hypothetical protein